MKLGIGVDIGGSHLTSCAVDLTTGKLIQDTLFDAPVNSKGSKEEIYHDWSRPINKTLAAVTDQPIVGIGFGMPGAFNYKKGIGLFEGNDKYDALRDANIQEEFAPYLSKQLSLFRFINDATAFAVGTAWFGKAKNSNRSISITLGTGFGSAFIDDGVPIVNGNNVPKYGSLWHLPFKLSIADNYFSTRWFTSQYEELTGQRIKGLKEIISIQDEKLVQRIIDEFVANLSDFMTPWIQQFQPDMLVIGGNISRAWNLMESAFHSHMTSKGITIQVEISKLLETAAVCGSARLLVEDYWTRVKDDLPEN